MRKLLVLSLLLGFGCDDAGLGNTGARDKGLLDGSTRDAAVVDALVVDAAVEAPDADAAADAAGPRGFGADCRENMDCLGGFCVPGPDGRRVCSERCADDCPDGWECRPVENTRPDTVFICVAERRVQCLPCEHDGDCGAGLDRCVEIGAATYCARDCSTEECPEGSTCEEREIEGATVALCAPDEGSCDPCEDADGDGYGVGDECLGIDCDEESTDTHEGADELCDGKDNDCDSTPDEDLGPPPAGASCLADGVCAGTGLACVDGGWSCLYPEGYQPEQEATCDGLDNDCDGSADEDFDLSSDAEHCGACGEACGFPHASGVCVESECALGDCEEGWWDVDGEGENGCEYACVPRAEGGGDEVCNSRDDDCDGDLDEGFDLQADPSHCGACDQACVVEHGAGACVEGECAIERCEDAWHNADGDLENGCEYGPCLPTLGGEEACDNIDNDCDGATDEDFDVQSDRNHCGACNARCVLANAIPECVAGECQVETCEPGFVDLDRLPETGCELSCVPDDPAVEACDERDNDCDGRTDETFDVATDELNCGACGTLCAPDAGQGQCRDGQCFVVGCEEGFVDLDGRADNGCEYACAFTGDELCNLADDDCDGETDEDFDLADDVAHCGECGNACAFDDAQASCTEGVCQLAACDEGYHDVDEDEENGCEYGPCTPTNESVEACDLIDND